jgi:hypothetical protein
MSGMPFLQATTDAALALGALTVAQPLTGTCRPVAIFVAFRPHGLAKCADDLNLPIRPQA